MIDVGGGFRMIADAEPQHRGIAEPECQAGQKADFGHVDRVQSPRRIDAIAHRAAGKDAGADIVADRIAGEGGERVDAVGNIGAADRAHREQIIKRQGEIAGGDEQRGQRDRAVVGFLDGFDDVVDVDAAQHVVQHVAGDRDDRDADHNTQLMQDLLLAQKRDRPAYCFQHLDLELRSNGDPFGESARTSAPGQAVLARFCAEWNSVGENKTRSFNILRANSRKPVAQFCCNCGGSQVPAHRQPFRQRPHGAKPPGRAATIRPRNPPDRPQT